MCFSELSLLSYIFFVSENVALCLKTHSVVKLYGVLLYRYSIHNKFWNKNAHCSHQCGTHIWIFKYLEIYLEQIIHLSKYLLIFLRENILAYILVICLYWRINLDIHSSKIYDREYSWTFIAPQKWFKMVFNSYWICDIFILPNIIRYSFV